MSEAASEGCRELKAQRSMQISRNKKKIEKQGVKQNKVQEKSSKNKVRKKSWKSKDVNKV